MTTQRSERIPEWTLGDRLRKARSMTGMSVKEFATHIGVSHGTVTNAETDARAVRPITMKAWSLATGVPIEWLEDGTGPVGGPPSPTDGPKGGREKNELASLTAQKAARARGTSGGANNRRYVAAA